MPTLNVTELKDVLMAYVAEGRALTEEVIESHLGPLEKSARRQKSEIRRLKDELKALKEPEANEIFERFVSAWNEKSRPESYGADFFLLVPNTVARVRIANYLTDKAAELGVAALEVWTTIMESDGYEVLPVDEEVTDEA